MDNEKVLEQEMAAKGLTAPRIATGGVDSKIKAEFFGRASDLFKGCPGSSALATLTICVLELENGFTVLGHSACASLANFDPEIGEKLARKSAREKIWPLEGYLLKQRLFDSGKSVPPSDEQE
nr:Gp49 family protein [uncultured Acetobacter sp.]